jgi:hypothetical protein
MTSVRRIPLLVRIGLPVVAVLVLAACTPGGQFDPTSIFANDMFDTKKKLQGDRQPVFPNGVPGIENGVPPELVKGYQPPPDQPADTAAAPDGRTAPDAAAEAAAQPKPKPKPKPKLARAPAQPQAQDPAFNQRSTRINIGPAPKPSTPPAPDTSQSVWPTPPPTAPAQQTAAPAQSVWPAPPPTGPAQQQPSQSIWPNPPAPGAPSH